ncbi:uncharacterized protein A4U43_UnF9040 [Asparagus officinalis]|uniref:Uncharacterized protein n=1 Tax=Asparagus officinalis TaxID=4686 RepID=A0A1R3L5T6_ASPOF|nr:uncharacterized protein A4U43_UnF9040 [Asparagus officinalis]
MFLYRRMGIGFKLERNLDPGSGTTWLLKFRTPSTSSMWQPVFVIAPLASPARRLSPVRSPGPTVKVIATESSLETIDSHSEEQALAGFHTVRSRLPLVRRSEEFLNRIRRSLGCYVASGTRSGVPARELEEAVKSGKDSLGLRG